MQLADFQLYATVKDDDVERCLFLFDDVVVVIITVAIHYAVLQNVYPGYANDCCLLRYRLCHSLANVPLVSLSWCLQ